MLAIAVWIAVLGWRAIEKAGYDACLSSLTVAISQNEDAIKLMAESADWRILSESEVHLVIRNLRPGDCGRIADPEFDMMGRRIHVALRRPSEEKRLTIILWSNGRDGIEGTADDVIMPYGEKIPR